MSAVPTSKKRERQPASQAPARHSGEGRNLVSPQRGSSSHDGSDWKESRLDEAVEIIRGITFPSGAKAKVPSGDSIACLRTTNVQREVEWDDLWYVAKSFVKRESQFVRENDILISNANSYELVGKVALIRNVPTPATLGTFITLFRTRSGNDPRFVYFQLSSSKVQAAIRSMASTTTNISNISTAKLAQIVLRFPSLSKQRQIVAEIEKQFTRLDAGVAALRRVQANLKRYRAAVLKAACEGRLVPTEAELAKAEGRTYETGEQLLARILADRRKNWRGRGKYKEPSVPDTTNLPPLPAGWTWATVEQLAEVVRGASPRPAGDPRYFGGPIPWITVGPLTADQSPYLRSVRITLNEAGRERSRFIEPHTLLLTNSGATLGVPKISLIGGCINDGVAALQGVGYPSKLYLLYFLHTQTQRLRGVNQGAAQPNLNTTIIKAINVPFPPLAEQARIVAEVERRLSIIEELQATVAAILQRATRLRESILQRAFE